MQTNLIEQMAAAEAEVTQSAHQYETVALAHSEQQATPKELEQAAKALAAAEGKLKAIKAAQQAATSRATREAEQAAAAEAAAHHAIVQNGIKAVRQAALKWDAALDALESASKEFEETSRNLHLIQADRDTLRRAEDARGQAYYILTHRLHSLVGNQYRLPNLTGVRLLAYLPEVAE